MDLLLEEEIHNTLRQSTRALQFARSLFILASKSKVSQRDIKGTPTAIQSALERMETSK